MRFLAAIVLVLVAAGAGFLSGRGSGDADEETRALLRRIAHQLERPAAAPAPVVRAAGPDAEALRAVVREEVGRGPAAPEPAREDEPAEPPETPEARRARADGRAIVDGALAVGRWTAADRDALGELAPALGAAGVQELLGMLIPAMNAQRIRVDVVGPII